MSIQKNVNVKIQEAIGSRWPMGVVSYYLDSNSYDNIIARRLRSVINVLESASCLKFNLLSEKPNNISWIYVTNPNRERECVHDTKYHDDGEITLVLGYDCLNKNELLHALLHGIGLNDEVTHPHRDRYIRVLWNNIRPERRKLFRIEPQDASKVLSEYDPLSIMQFHDRAFSSNGQPTIVPLISGLMINPSEELSQLDKMKLRLLFEHECNKRKVGDLLDSCKNAFHTKLEGSITDASNSVQEDNVSNNNITKDISDEHNEENIDTLKDSLGDNNERALDANENDKVSDNDNEVQEHSVEKSINQDQEDVDQDKHRQSSKDIS
ncbi:seminal metalloprotease 1-like [Zerene cesonia]|uniref:seminal metalloprotease 1-like n=1 Tax=Zerene cesonia TaxID=33412 RepID=UPI0018E53961|nr:seminal metalloprotease 1-like [Zerene cesonia]